MSTSAAAAPEAAAAFTHIYAFLATCPRTAGVVHDDCRYELVDNAPHDFRVFGHRYEQGFGMHELDCRLPNRALAEAYAAAARADGFSMVHVSPPQCEYRGVLWAETAGMWF